MTEPDDTPTPEDPARAASLQEVEKLLSAVSTDSGDLHADLQRALELATHFFGLAVGIVSRVEGDEYTIDCVHQPEGAGLEVGQRFPLGDTYCSITLQADDVIAIHDMRSSDHNEHPCYEAFRLESYIGVPLRVDGEPYGTLNFSSPDARPRPWTSTEEDLARLLALWVQSAISRHRLGQRLAAVVRELDEKNRDLEERNQDLDFYARHASHDLQAPLKNILALMDLFGLEGGVPSSVNDDLGLIREEVGRMLQMIQAILRFSRTSRADFNPAIVDLGACCEAAMDALKETIERSQARISVGALPTARGDAALLTQVLQNLLENGMKYQPVGQRPELVISGREEGDRVLLMVQDNGIGLDEASADLVFKPLGRLHHSEEYEGSGLGLTICRKVLRRHGGDLSYRSTPGEGATFVLELPKGG